MEAQVPPGKRRYLLQMKDGTQKKIDVPEDWRVTFGPLVPGAKSSPVNSVDGVALRLWSGSKGKEIQHAVFLNVESFRDMSISILEQVEKSKTEVYRREGDDSGEAIHAEVKVKEWVNPDAPRSEPTGGLSREVDTRVPGRLIQSIR